MTFKTTDALLMHKAQQITNLSDWGDNHFLVGLKMLLDTCKQEAFLSTNGQQWFEEECLRWLKNRLLIEDTLKKHPEILQVKIHKPIIILGLPRSGSTFLYRLLAQKTGARTPLFWELWQPAPPPDSKTRSTDPRIKEAQTYIQNIESHFPNLSSMHFLDANEPEECFQLFQNSFSSFDTTFFFHIPKYQDWICQLDLTSSYHYYKKQLQLLLWRCPGEPLILKNFGHLLGLDKLIDIFPDVQIIHIHRHPQEVMASLCSLQSNVINLWREKPMENKPFGEFVLHRWIKPLEIAMKTRSTLDSKYFYDVHYKDLLQNPLKTISEIHEYFGNDIDNSTLTQMKQWLQNNPQHKHGKHEYHLEKFGLTRQQVDEKYADYIERFNIIKL